VDAVGHVVTIDGPAGAGTSTAARGLASRLGWFHLDSGSLYRAVAWHVRSLGLDARSADDRERAALAMARTIAFERDASGSTVLVLDGQRPGSALRTEAIAEAASLVAADGRVREILGPVQKDARSRGDLVAEGRDMGTAIFPDADVKFFLDADLEARTERRRLEIASSGEPADPAGILADLCERDERDRTRPVSPLVAAPDAVLVDTTHLSIEQVLSTLLGHVRARIPGIVEGRWSQE
jgi:cytidylate kinase